MQKDYALDTLLDLHQQILAQEGGFWIKIEAHKVEASEHIPHGIRYSLTLHDRHGTRVLGYDNAHSVHPAKFKYAGQVLSYDHKHRSSKDKGVPYEFKDPQQLLSDFFADVDRVLEQVKK